MQKSYPIGVLVFIYLLEFIFAQGQTKVTCPNYSYKCPDCKNGQFCSYPMNYGCEKSGMPVCQAKCTGIICAAKALPCPDECPFSCQYHGPPCCPFIGAPTCLPPCQTLVPCKITPCPDDCPDNCFYPNADYCCPYSGQPECRAQLGDSGSGQQSKLLKREEIHGNNATFENAGADSHDSGSTAQPNVNLIENEKESPICIDMIVPCPPECPNDCQYPTDVPCPLTHPPKCRSPINAGQNRASATEKLDKILDIVGEQVSMISQLEELLRHEQQFLEWLNQQHNSPTPPNKPCTTSSTTIRLPSSKICPMIYVPCPELCPTTCIRPADAPCPFAVPGYCP